MRAICYTAIAAAAEAPATQSSFGLSAGTAGVASTNTNCGSDYIEITSALDAASVVGTTNPLLGSNPAELAHKICGRALNNEDTGAAATVCSAAMPFRIGVNFDADEDTDTATAANDERFMDTGGIVGFKLAFTQVSS